MLKDTIDPTDPKSPVSSTNTTARKKKEGNLLISRDRINKFQCLDLTLVQI